MLGIQTEVKKDLEEKSVLAKDTKALARLLEDMEYTKTIRYYKRQIEKLGEIMIPYFQDRKNDLSRLEKKLESMLSFKRELEKSVKIYLQSKPGSPKAKIQVQPQVRSHIGQVLKILRMIDITLCFDFIFTCTFILTPTLTVTINKPYKLHNSVNSI